MDEFIWDGNVDELLQELETQEEELRYYVDVIDYLLDYIQLNVGKTPCICEYCVAHDPYGTLH